VNFSRRTEWHREPNRLTEALAGRRNLGLPVADLTLSNPTECGLSYPAEQILTALAAPDSLHYSPDPKGLLSAREAVARFYGDRRVSVEPEHVFITSGSSESYSHLFRILCNPGDAVLVPAPSYPLFDYLAQINDLRTESYGLMYDHGWRCDPGALRQAITASTRAIILINPHNPTGMFLKQKDFGEIQGIAADRGLSLIVDEVFSAYGIGDDSGRVATTAGVSRCLTFTLNGLSKLCALPQMKLGWIVVGGPDEMVRESIGRLEIVSDTFLSANTPVQQALPGLFRAGEGVRAQIIERCGANREFLASTLSRGSVCSLLDSEGGWNAILRVPTTKSEEAWALELLERAGVYVYPGYFFDFTSDGYLVVSLLPEPAEFRRSVGALLGHIDNSTNS
jgi:hypothetical protein